MQYLYQLLHGKNLLLLGKKCPYERTYVWLRIKNLYYREQPKMRESPNGLVFDPNCGINAFFLNL